MSDSIPEDLRPQCESCRGTGNFRGVMTCPNCHGKKYVLLEDKIAERISTLTAAKQDVERENERLREGLTSVRSMQSRAGKAEGERNRLRGDLFELSDVVTAENFAEMQQRAETAEAQLQAMQQEVERLQQKCFELNELKFVNEMQIVQLKQPVTEAECKKYFNFVIYGTNCVSEENINKLLASRQPQPKENG